MKQATNTEYFLAYRERWTLLEMVNECCCCDLLNVHVELGLLVEWLWRLLLYQFVLRSAQFNLVVLILDRLKGLFLSQRCLNNIAHIAAYTDREVKEFPFLCPGNCSGTNTP